MTDSPKGTTMRKLLGHTLPSGTELAESGRHAVGCAVTLWQYAEAGGNVRAYRAKRILTGQVISLRCGLEPVMSRVEARYVTYDQIQFSTTATRLRDPTRNSTWTMPQSHQAMAPRNRTKPKSATADFRPIVARLPICR